MANFGPLTAEIGSLVCGTPANFNRFHLLASLLHRPCSSEANQTLHSVWPSPALVHYIYIFRGSCPLKGLLPPNGILPGAKFTLHPSLAFSYIGSIRCPSCHTNKCQRTGGKMKALTPISGQSSSFLHTALDSWEPGSVTPVP